MENEEFIMNKLFSGGIPSDRYFEILAERLCLSELVGMECDPVEFLKQSMLEAKEEQGNECLSRWKNNADINW